MKHVAPSAANRVCVDLDATIIPWGPLETVRPPYPGVVAAMRALRDAGYFIFILTSRLSPTWWHAEMDGDRYRAIRFGQQQTALVHAILAEGGVPYDAVTCEKVPAAAYFDDKAIQVGPHNPTGAAILKFLEEHDE